MSGFDPAARALAVGGRLQSRRAAIRDRLRQSIARTGGRLPGIMAAPPTVVVSAGGAATAIPGSVLFGIGDAVQPDRNRRLYDLIGATWAPIVPTGFGSDMWKPVTQRYGNGANPSASTGARLIFGFDGDRFELFLRQTVFRLSIDGEYAKDGGTFTGDYGQGYRRILVTFPDARARRVEFEFRDNDGLFGVQCDPATPPYRPVRADTLRLVVNGDSFGDTIAAPTPDQIAARNGTLGANIGRLAGQLDCINSSVGGSGFLNPANNGGNTFGQRVELDIIAPRPDVVFELGGLNDNGFLPQDPAKQAALRAAIDSWLGKVTSLLPDALVVMTGPMNPNGENGPNILLVRDIKREVAARYPRQVVFIDNCGDGVDKGWVTGVPGGRAGNASRVTGTDLTHPSVLGAEYLARRIVAATGAAV